MADGTVSLLIQSITLTTSYHTPWQSMFQLLDADVSKLEGVSTFDGPVDLKRGSTTTRKEETNR